MSLTWIIPALSLALAAAGVALLAWSLFWDRARGQKRCPMCWYDMAGAAGLVCPECGHDARREKRLRKTRRRWGWAGAACVVIVVAIAAYVGPKIRADGWTSVVPNALLILMLPNLSLSPSDASPSRDFVDWRKSLYSELRERIQEEGRMSGWEQRWLIRRCLRDRSGGMEHLMPGSADIRRITLYPIFNSWSSPETRTDVLRSLRSVWDELAPHMIMTRDSWVAGEDLHVLLLPQYNWLGNERFRMTARIHSDDGFGEYARSVLSSPSFGYPGNPRHDHNMVACGRAPISGNALEIEILMHRANWLGPNQQRFRGPHSIWRNTISIPVRLVSDVDEILDPHACADLDSSIRDKVKVSISISQRYPRVGFELDFRQSVRVPGGMAFGADVEVEIDDILVATGEMRENSRAEPHSLRKFNSVKLVLIQDVHEIIELLDTGEGRVRVRVRCNPMIALRDFRATSYWSGKLNFDLSREDIAVYLPHTPAFSP